MRLEAHDQERERRGGKVWGSKTGKRGREGEGRAGDLCVEASEFTMKQWSSYVEPVSAQGLSAAAPTMQ